MGDDVVITYETLFELLRREKTRGELQQLDSDFFVKVTQYVAQKRSLLGKQPTASSLFGEEERLRTEKQLQNIRRVIRELYETREKKVLDMALNASRTTPEMVADEALIEEEREFYQELTTILNKKRSELLMNIFIADPVVEETKEEEPKGDVKVKFVQSTEQFAGTDMQLYGPYDKGATETFPPQLAKMLIARGCAEMIK